MAELGSGSGSDYPTSIDTDANKESSSTSARANVPNDLAAAIIAIMTELGTDPAGSLATVKDFLQAEHNIDGTHVVSSVSWVKDGLVIASASGAPTTDVDVDFDVLTVSSTGNADGTLVIIANGNYTLELDQTGQINALDTGSAANDTLYYIWVLNGTSGTGVVASTSSTLGGVTKPSGYTAKGRLVGYIHTNGSAQVRAFTRVGNYWRYDDPVQDLPADSSITANVAKTVTLSVPPNTLAHILLDLDNTSDSGDLGGAVFPTGAADTTSNLDESSVSAAAVQSVSTHGGGMVIVPVDGSSQCKYMATEPAGITTVIINTLGYWDSLGGGQ
ncbi:hypothetical protein LCGC14_1777430 [marine sediment metagenome]|uniref:Uncharacterized protein n=1 Tax=marine sediment metagenome TaxID=412755 RepID=A0A0F9JBB1_9ZZZZ